MQSDFIYDCTPRFVHTCVFIASRSTGKERDAESGLDYFGARYYGSSMGRFMSPDPSNLGVDIYLPQTWNRYAYVVNNPLSLVDKNGLWPTRIHEQIIDNAFPGLTPGMRQALKNASYDMDHKAGAQETVNAPEHAMSEGDWADDNHVQRTADFINNSEAAATDAQAQWSDMGAANISPVALLQFGNALHTISDGTSPSHEGGQPWDGVWHLSSAWHWAREQYISPARMNQAVNAERSAFRKTFGDQFYFMAIGQQQPQERVTSRIVPDSIKPVDQTQ
jgi:RHS repeat-associated protein